MKVEAVQHRGCPGEFKYPRWACLMSPVALRVNSPSRWMETTLSPVLHALRENADPGGALFILPEVLLTAMWVTFISFLSNYFLDTPWGCQRSKEPSAASSAAWPGPCLWSAIGAGDYSAILLSPCQDSFLRRREGRIFGWGCWEHQPSHIEVPVPRQWVGPGTAELVLSLLGTHISPLSGDNKAAENRFVAEKNPCVECAPKWTEWWFSI